MTKDNDLLLNMLQEKKISEAEFKLLSSAIDKKPSWKDQLFTLLINPFHKIAGFYALAAGMAIIVLMSALGVIAKVYFVGILSILNASVVKNPKFQINFLMLLSQNLICWGVLSVLFMLAAKLCHQKRIRIIDFLGTVALSRFPYLIITLL